MKLYVWNDVLEDYTSGIAFALADNIDDARYLIYKGYLPNWNGAYSIRDPSKCVNVDDKQAVLDSLRANDGNSFGFLLHQEPKIYDSDHGEYLYGGG